MLEAIPAIFGVCLLERKTKKKKHDAINDYPKYSKSTNTIVLWLSHKTIHNFFFHLIFKVLLKYNLQGCDNFCCTRK